MSETVKFWTTFILALIGALAWLPPIIGVLKPCKIEGKILSQYANFGKLPNGSDSSIMVQKVSLYSKNKNFYLRDVEVYVKFPNEQNELKCTLWTWRNLSFTFDENGRKVQRRLNIESKDYLSQLTILPKNESVVGYLSFSYDYLKDEKYDYLRYVFVDFNGSRKELVISQNNMVSSTQLFDDRIWVEQKAQQ